MLSAMFAVMENQRISKRVRCIAVISKLRRAVRELLIPFSFRSYFHALRDLSLGNSRDIKSLSLSDLGRDPLMKKSKSYY